MMLGGVSGQAMAEEEDEEDEEETVPTFVVEQGDREYEVEAIQGSQPVRDFYNRDPQIRAARNADVGIQTVATPYDTSEVMFYDGPNGLSLVFAHLRYPDPPAGSAEFQVKGLPAGRWAIRDGLWIEDSDPYQLQWSWGTWGAGGVYSGAFDETFAALIEPKDSDDIESWNVVSGNDRKRIGLNLDKPLVVRSEDGLMPSPTSFVLEQGSSEYQVDALSTGQTIESFYGDGNIAPGVGMGTSSLFFWDDPERETDRGTVDEVSLGVVNGRVSDTVQVDFDYSGLPRDGEWVVKDSPSDTFTQNRTEWKMLPLELKGGAYRDAADYGTQLRIDPDWSSYNPLEDIEIDLPDLPSPSSVAEQWHHTKYVDSQQSDGLPVEGFEPPVWIVAMGLDHDYLAETGVPNQAPQTYDMETRGGEYKVVPQENAPQPSDLYLVVKPRTGGTPSVKVVSTSSTIPSGSKLLFDGKQLIDDVPSVDLGLEFRANDYTWPYGRWQMLTGDASDPFRYQLDATHPITIHPGTLDTPLHRDIEDRIRRLENELDATEDGANPPLDPGTASLLNDNQRDFLSYVEKNYESVGGEPLEQFDEGLERLIQTQKVTKAAVTEPPEAIRSTVRFGALGIVLAALGAGGRLIKSVRGGDASLGGSSLRRRIEDSALSELASTGRNIVYGRLGLDQLAHQAYRQVSNIKDGIIDEFQDAVGAGERSERIDVYDVAVNHGIPQAYDRGKDLGVIDPAENAVESLIERLSEELYRLHLFGGMGGRLSLPSVNVDGLAGTFLEMLQIFAPLPVMGVDGAAQNRATDIENAFDSRSLDVNDRLRRERLADAGAATISERSESMIETFEGIDDLLEGLSRAEFGSMALILVTWGIEKVLAASGIAKISAAATIISFLLSVLTIVGKVILVIAGAAAIVGLAFMKLIEALHFRVTFYTATYDNVPRVSEA